MIQMIKTGEERFRNLFEFASVAQPGQSDNSVFINPVAQLPCKQ
jgi:hypothetical protein